MIKLAMGNGKTGPAFSIANKITCPGATETCKAVCYVDTGRMAMHKDKRFAQYKEVITALKDGRLAQTLSMLIKGHSVATLRIHDSGDFFSPSYVRAWIDTCKDNPNVKFWAYTRSFTVPGIFKELLELAALDNVSIWLSADHENWLTAYALYKQHSDTLAGISYMQLDGDDNIVSILNKGLPAKNFVNFPTHGHFGKIKTQLIDSVPNCPAITKEIKHETIPACLVCRKCLPD